MNWKVVFYLSLIGILMGFLSVAGYTKHYEFWFWLAFSGITIFVLLKKVVLKLFLHAFLIGLFWSILNALVQCAFFDLYFNNNPQLQASFDGIPIEQARWYMLLTGPVIGLLVGLALGGLAWLSKKFFR